MVSRRIIRGNQAVREQFDYTFLTGEWRIGQMLLQEKKAGREATSERPPEWPRK
jgi:hypothetical protein